MRLPRLPAVSRHFPMVSVAVGMTLAGSADSLSVGTLLQFDSLGRLVEVPSESVPADLLPPKEMGLESQQPNPPRGLLTPEAVLERQEQGRQNSPERTWFPGFQPHLEPYLAGIDSLGNTALRPGPLFSSSPLDSMVQSVKYQAAGVGLNYSLTQTLTVAHMSPVNSGNETFGFYTFDWMNKWTVYSAPKTAGWISAQFKTGHGLGSDQPLTAASKLGSLTSPTGIWSGRNDPSVPELAWQQAFNEGQFVMLAGVVSQGNYIDANSYANSGRGQFLNSALINSMVVPLPSYAPSLNLQWQWAKEWYVLVGPSLGGTSVGEAPWVEFQRNQWSVVSEVGYAPVDFMGLGHGVYRVQPFVAQAAGPVQTGVGLNVQQRLGKVVPIGWFGRFGVGGGETGSSATAQVGTGFVMLSPLSYLGIVEGRSNDTAGIGFIWSQPAPSTGFERNEMGLETGYVLQLTPVLRLQPDIQMIWNPAYTSQANSAVVLQLQAVLSW